MRYLQAVAVGVFAAALMMAAAGCGDQSGTPKAGEGGAQAAQLQKDLDQAKLDLKAAQDQLAAINTELAAKNAKIQTLQKELDAANAKLAEITKTVQDAMKMAAPPMAPAAPQPQ
jgi:predicted  nucleic acid-binding Zn-ribbon protein